MPHLFSVPVPGPLSCRISRSYAACFHSPQEAWSMIEENIQQKSEEENIPEENSSKPNFVNQIDDIINKYKSQLQQLKTNSFQNNKNKDQIPQTPITTNSQKRIIPLVLTTPPPEIKKKDIQEINPPQFSSELSKEMQNDNIKLQSALTAEKLNVVKLTSQIENYEIELNKAKEEILDLQNQLTNKENEFMAQMNNMTNNINNDINKLKEQDDLNRSIIQKFFELFNKNIDLFNKSKILSCDKNTRINYLENDIEGNNQKLSIFVVNSLDILINKLLQAAARALRRVTARFAA